MKIFFLLLIFTHLLYSTTSFEMKKGWQLQGFATTLEINDYFNNSNVLSVWAYDASSQSWSAFSPDENKSITIEEKYSTLLNIQAYQALWIHSTNDWTLNIEEEKSFHTTKNNSIPLEIGWNLISLPQKTVISKELFKNEIVWKYSDANWSVNNDSLDFPSLTNVKLNDGLWVKSEIKKTIHLEKDSSKLHSFTSKENMLSYIEEMLSLNNYYYEILPSVDIALESTTTADTATKTNATTTNVQELGVDEGDILKHDGEYIYNIDTSNEKIIVTSFKNIVNKIYTPITSLDYTDKNIQTLYLQNSRLLVISNNKYIYNYPEKDIRSTIAYTNSNLLNIDIYDVSDVANISQLSSHTIDGSYHDSRLIDNEFYIISTYSPSTSKLIPSISVDSNITNDLVNHNTFYAPLKLNQQAGITSISKFDIETASYIKNTSFLGYAHTIYTSLNAIYLVSNEYPLYYDFLNYKEQQTIYKFALDENLTYKGKGNVEGRILNQFSLSEKDDYLRIATTSGWAWFNGGETSNSLYTLKEDSQTLSIQGKLTGLGHEGESIYSVRFVDSRAYVVTFRRTDPLYTIDLSNPLEPILVGELSIPGFSTYLHPVDENRILSIGRDADESGRATALQIQLFDISDFANPKLADKIQVGDSTSYSEAEYNHKALSYRSNDFMFGIPYREYNNSKYQEHFSNFQIKEFKIEKLSTLTSENSNWGNSGRGIIFDSNNTTYSALFKGSNILCETIK